LRDSDYCVFHDPEHADVVQKHAGRRPAPQAEATLATAYDFEELGNVIEIRRLVEGLH
jgi:hypothetical protein